MSIAGLLDAMRADLPPATRLVWQCIENHIGSNGHWSMTNEQIAEELHMHVNTVDTSVRLLERLGIIGRDRVSRNLTRFRMRVNGNDPQNLWLKPEGNDPQNLWPIERMTHKKSPSFTNLTHKKCGPESNKKESTKGSPPSTSAKSTNRTDQTPGFFDEFWDQYPRKVAKRHAAKAYAQALARGATPAEILTGLQRHKFTPDPQYQPHPATWLNGDRWLDEGSSRQRPAADQLQDHIGVPSLLWTVATEAGK